MEFKEVLGIRRSIRYFDPERPVEREKVQKVLEAMRIASCAVNAHWLRAVVVRREDILGDALAKLQVPTAGPTMEFAPVHIYCYADLGVVNRVKGARLKELVDVGALNPSHGWSHKFVDEFIYPQLLKPLTESPAYAVAAAFDAGGAAFQGLLLAYDEGLGACWTAFNTEAAKSLLEIPDSWIPLYVMCLGYPLESRAAGGQRPRPDFEELYFEGRYGQPFRRDPAVVKDLERRNMLQPSAPLANRKQEVREISRKLGLPE